MTDRPQAPPPGISDLGGIADVAQREQPRLCAHGATADDKESRLPFVARTARVDDVPPGQGASERSRPHVVSGTAARWELDPAVVATNGIGHATSPLLRKRIRRSQPDGSASLTRFRWPHRAHRRTVVMTASPDSKQSRHWTNHGRHVRRSRGVRRRGAVTASGPGSGAEAVPRWASRRATQRSGPSSHRPAAPPEPPHAPGRPSPNEAP